MADNEVSPTGAPMLPPRLVPWLAALVGLAAILSQSLPPHTAASKVAAVIAGLGGVLGVASPGLRRQQ